MKKGKWHYVNGKLKRIRRPKIQATPDARPQQEKPQPTKFDTALDQCWSALNTEQKLRTLFSASLLQKERHET